jgi:hypothetical protein
MAAGGYAGLEIVSGKVAHIVSTTNITFVASILPPRIGKCFKSNQ